VADATARFAVQLEDETSGAADAAAGALDKLRQKIEGDQKALRAMEAAMRGMQKGTVVNIEAFKSLSSQIASKRNAIAGATADFVSLGGSFNKMKRPAQEAGQGAAAAGTNITKLGQAASAAGGPLGGLIGKLKNLSGAGLAGLAVAAAAAVVALGAGLAYGFGKLISFAISSQEALEGVSDEAIRVSKRSPIARAQIAALSDELEKTGLRGAALEKALEKALPKRFGKEAQKSMMGFSVQLAKAKENAALLFTGIKTEGMQKGLASILSLLDESTASGAALKSILETTIQPIADAAAAAAPKVRAFFLGVGIGALRAATAVLNVGNAIKKAAGIKFGGSDLDVDFQAVGTAAGVAAIGVLALAAGLGAIAAIALGSMAAVLAVGAAIGFGIATGVAMAINTGQALWNWLQNTHALFAQAVGELKAAGKDMMKGLADGIKDGASAVITAATNTAKDAVKAVKSALGIASPSKVFAGIGAQTSEGMAGGIDSGSGSVESAASDMLSIPSSAPSAGGGAAGGSRTVTITIENLNVTGIEGADDPAFGAKLAEQFRQLLPLLGAPEPA
jgi:hypothetical protein